MALRLPAGTSLGGPIKSNTQSAVLRQEVTSLTFRSNPRLWFEEFTDFAQATQQGPWTARVVGTTPTFTQLANTPGGVYQAALAATSEAETVGVDWGDNLMLNQPSAGAVNVNAISVPIFQAYVRIPTALTTAQTAVIGIGTAFNATLTSVAEYAWFRFNANNNVLLEAKDGVTTTTGQAPTAGTLTLTANKFYLFTIDMTYLDAVKFFVDDNLAGTISMIGLTAAIAFQPVIYLQKASGTTTPHLDVDWCHTICWRAMV